MIDGAAMSQYIAAYDISHSSSRNKVARILLGFGVRIQKSVYQLELDPADVPELQRTVGGHLSKEDRFDLVPIDLHPARLRLAWQTAPAGLEAVVIV